MLDLLLPLNLANDFLTRPGLQPVYAPYRNHFSTSTVLTTFAYTALKQPEVPRHGRESLPHSPWLETRGTSAMDGIDEQGYVYFRQIVTS